MNCPNCGHDIEKHGQGEGCFAKVEEHLLCECAREPYEILQFHFAALRSAGEKIAEAIAPLEYLADVLVYAGNDTILWGENANYRDPVRLTLKDVRTAVAALSEWRKAKGE